MTISKVTMYQSADGTVDKSEEDALQYEAERTLWLDALDRHERYDEVVFAYKEDFIKFIKDNAETILKVL